MKHIPMRMCIQTRERVAKSDLVRFVIDPEEKKFTIDLTGKARSRGANLTRSIDVYDEAVKSKAFERALDSKITDEEYAEVRLQLLKYIEKYEFRKGRDTVSVRIKGDEINLG